MKFVHSYRPTSSNPVAITFLSIVAIASFPTIVRATPKEKPIWSFQYKPAPNAPSNCPTEEYLRTALAANTDGQDPFTKDAPRAIIVTIEPISNQVEARITTRDENGTITNVRALHAPAWRCDQLAENIVFTLQDIVDPLQLPSTNTAATPNTSQTPTTVPPKNEPTLSETPQASVNRPSKNESPPASADKPLLQRSWKIPQFGLSLGGGSAWWNASEMALSTTIGIEAIWKRVTIGIEGHYDYAWAVPNVRDSRAERSTVMVLVCSLYRWSERFMLRGCGFGDFGRLSIEFQTRDTINWYAPVADIGGRIGGAVWLVPRFGIELRADAAYAIARPQVRMLDDRIWRAAPFTGAVRLAFLGAFDVF